MTRLAPLLAVLVLTAGCSWKDLPLGGGTFDVPAPRDVLEPPDNFVPGDADAPGFAVASVEPARGPVTGGTRVSVAGTGFVKGSTVVFGSTEAAEIVVQNDGSILATTPPHPAGWVGVVVERPDGKWARLDDAFFFEARVGVDGVEPDLGPAAGGTPVTVRGSGFLAGSRLLVGGRQAQDTRVLDEQTLLAVTPPGAAGPRDVVVVNESGVGTARRAFRYVAEPAVGACEPPVVPEGRETVVRVTGTGLADAALRPSAGSFADPATGADGAVTVRFQPDGPGPVAVEARGPGGASARAACLWVATEAELADPVPRVLSATPAEGSVDGGDEVVVTALGVEGVVADALAVAFGAGQATLLSVDRTGRALRVRTPPAAQPGNADVVLSAPQGQAVLESGFRYVPAVVLDEVDPATGPAEGGTLVDLRGRGLDQVSEVFIGPRPATVVAGPTPGALRVRTAPASPGRHDVVLVTGSGRRVVQVGGFVFGAAEPDLVAVTPDSGSQAGGTLVSVAGAGMGPDVVLFFGGQPAVLLDASDPARLKVRTPMALAAGRVDVEARWPTGETRMLRQAYGYFDPTGYFGGVWGEPVNGAVNVTVLDSGNDRPVSNAFVILGSDAGTAYKGRTDLRGQVTLSGEDVFGPVQATAAREDYSVSTVAGVDAENITLHLDSMIPAQGGGGGGGATQLPPGIISGVVGGADKYLLAPPDSCVDRPLVHGTLCAACGTDTDCGEGSSCVPVAGGGFHCASGCAGHEDCPEGYACYGLDGGGTGCQPGPGRPEVRCDLAARSAFSSSRPLGPGARAADDGSYALSARVGEVAVYCVGGLRRFDDGTFEPVALGVARHVPVSSARVTPDVAMDLSIPLDREVDLRLVNPPGGPDGPNDHEVTVALDLGSDGVLRLWDTLEATDGERFVLRHVPRDFGGPLEGALLYVHAEANSRTADTVPYSSSEVLDWTPGGALGVVQVIGPAGRLLDPDVVPDATGGCLLPAGGALVLGRGGRAWDLSAGGAVTTRPSLGRSTLRACAVRGDDLLAVGDGGAILRVGAEGLAVAEVTPGSRDLRALAFGADGTAWAAGDGVLLRRDGPGTWVPVPYGAAAPLDALVALPDGTLFAAGAKGIVVRIAGGVASPVLPLPADRDLLAATSLGGLPLLVGARGLALLGDGAGNFTTLPTGTLDDLRTVAALPDGTALAAGSRGTLLRLSAGLWEPVPVAGFAGEVALLAPGEDGSALAVAGDAIVVGPFLGIPRFTEPLDGLPWLSFRFAWTLPGTPDPSFTYTRIYGFKGDGDWSVSADGALREIVLPDLRAAAPAKSGQQPLPTLPSGDVILRTLHVLQDGFDMDAWDETTLYTGDWRSWAVEVARPIR